MTHNDEEETFITVKCDFDKSALDPFPGNDESKSMGCTCPIQDIWPRVIFSSICPIHQLEVRKEN